jgi:hypothetical protein
MRHRKRAMSHRCRPGRGIIPSHEASSPVGVQLHGSRVVRALRGNLRDVGARTGRGHVWVSYDKDCNACITRLEAGAGHVRYSWQDERELSGWIPPEGHDVVRSPDKRIRPCLKTHGAAAGRKCPICFVCRSSTTLSVESLRRDALHLEHCWCARARWNSVARFA